MANKIDNTLFYNLLFETASEGIIIADGSGKIELTNARTSELFGYSKEELLNLKVDDLLPKHLQERHKKYREDYVKTPRKRPMGQGYDLIGVRKDGSSIPIEISLNYYREGDTTKVMALIMDVTVRKEQEAQIKMLNSSLEKKVEKRTRELRESQRLYSLIARNFPNGTINVLDEKFNYIFVEGEDLYRYGVTSTNLMGRNYLERVPGEIKPTLESNLEKVLAGQNKTFEIEVRGEFYLINAVGLVDEEGKISSLLLVEQNITERKAAEEKTKDALKKEKQLNELKSRFVSLASHEFRTPLSSILSSLTLLEKYEQAGIPEKKPKHYQRIRSSVRHLTNILNDFLSLEKVEAGKVYLSISEFNLKQLLDDLVEQHQEITKKGQQIHFEHKGDELVESDQNMLRIIISNLLSNGIKYSGEGKNMWVSLSVDRDFFKIIVKDEGIGIPLDEQENLFSRFFRARNAINYEGTGLGLNIVSKYLQLLDGNITFTSEPEVGTTFEIEIPNHRVS